MNVKKRGLAPSDRRGLICFGGDAATPWAVFALAGDVVLRAARLDVSRETGDASDPGSPDSAGAGSAPVSPAFSALSSRSGSSGHTSGHTSGGSFVSSFGSSFFGKKNAKRPALLKMKGEHNKPLTCVCGGGADGVDVGLVYAGYADGAVFCYDLRTQTCVGSASLPRAVVTQKKGGSYASTDDAADPLGIAAEKEANASRDSSPRDDGPDANPNASLPGKAPNRSSNRKKPVRSKVPPPCTAMALVARGGDAVLVVADAAGRLTSWSARPKPPEFYPEPERKTTASATTSGAFGGDALSERPTVSERPTEGQRPLKMKKRKLGPGGAPALELLSGARASDSNAPAFALGALPDGRGVATLVGETNRITQSAFCVLKTFLVTVPLGRFVGVASRSRDREGGVISASTSPNNPFPPLPPAAHRVALAAHPTQARVAACAAAEARVRDTRGASSDSFTAFFASGNAGGAGIGGGGDFFSRALALRDRVEAEHVSTLAVASATPPPRRARVFYLGDDTSVWSVAFAEGPKASRRCALPPPPREAEGAVPARLRVAVTAADASADDASASAAGKEKARTRVLTKELFLTLSRVPGAEHCSVACVVDGATGAIVARVAARDAVFVTTANATETGTLCLAAIAADGASVEARPASAAAATSSASSFRIDLRALLALVHLSERADAPDGDRDRGRDRDGDRSVSAYRIFDGPELGSVAVACFVDERTSVFATFRLDAQNAQNVSRSGVAALLLDEPGERVVAAAWQLVGRGDGSRADAAPWGGLAVLTNRRLLLYEYALSDDDLVNVALTKRAETRNEIGQTIGSVLWVGPALLFSRADGVFVLGWDGGVSTACACGVGGGAELALSAATEDALLLFLDAADAGGPNGNATNATNATRNGNGASGNTRFPDFPNAVPFFRPVSAADALAIGWGSLVAAKRTSDGRVSDGLTLVARRAVASAFARHDASRVSFAALAHVARSLALPGLAANVASRATHLHATERAQFLVAARRVPAALETIRTYLNSGIDPEGPRAGDRAGTGAARDVPAAATDFFLASVLFDACEAAASAGDAAAAFDAASLAFGASGGTDTTALERLVEYGVADVDGDTHGDVLGDTLGGFQTIDALVERALAPGAAREACAAAARRRLRRERRHADAGGTNRMRVRPFDKAGLERASAGSGLTLGWSAVPASVAPETSGAPAGASSETSRVSVMTHADALGRRVAGAAPFHGGVEVDATRIQKVVKNEKNEKNFRDAEDSGNGFGSGSGLGARQRPEPLRVPGRDRGYPESGVSAAPGVVSPPPPPFQARFAGDSETDGDSEEDDPFPWSPAEEEGDDPFAAKEGDPFQGASFGSFGSFGSGPDLFAADVSANDAFGSATHAGTEPSHSGHSGFEPEQSQVLALPGPSADREFGAAPGAERGPAPVVVPSAPVAEPSEPFGVARGELAFGWDTQNAPVSHAPGDATFDAFGTPFSSTRGSGSLRGFGDGPVIDKEGGTATFQESNSPFAADAPGAVASRASLASPNPARLSLANPEPPRVAIEDEDEDDPFGAVSDEDPFGDAEEEEEEEEEEKDVSPRDATAIDSRSNRETTAAPSPFEDARRVIGAAVPPPPGAKAAPAPVEAPPPRPVARAANRTHPETLQWALRGIAALESCDYETCELAFKAATKLAVAGRAPSVRAAVKCRSYAIAARAARFARAVASTIENGSPTERAFGDDAKENRARTTRRAFVLSKGNNASAARELARLARHIAALPLDAKHRACACRFAAAWHFRLGAVALGGEYLAAAAAAAASAARLEGEETRQGASARAALAPLARCARAISRGAKPGGPFASGADTVPAPAGSPSAYAADANETAGWVCAATLRSLSASARPESAADDERIRRTDAEGSGAVECARCRAAHCEAFAGGDGAACAVCDQPFRPVKVPGVV